MEIKVWGIKERIFESNNIEIDILKLEPNSFCSIHYHEHKFNKFIVLNGHVDIQSKNGNVYLAPDTSIIVEPLEHHRFVTYNEPCSLIEIAYTIGKDIDKFDIVRLSKGGKIIDDKYVTLDELPEKNWEKE